MVKDGLKFEGFPRSRSFHEHQPLIMYSIAFNGFQQFGAWQRLKFFEASMRAFLDILERQWQPSLIKNT